MSLPIYTNNDRRFQNLDGIVREALNEHAEAINIINSETQRVINTASPTPILFTDGLLLFDSSSTAIAIELPAASPIVKILFKDSGANSSINNITFMTVGSDTITDSSTGQTTTIIASDGFSGSFQSNGAGTWYLM